MAISKEKIAIMAGSAVSGLTGAWLSTTVGAPLWALLGIGGIAYFTLQTATLIGGLGLGVGLAMQGLKHFAMWPAANNQNTIDFHPVALLKDALTALKSFDTEILKIIAQFKKPEEEQEAPEEQVVTHYRDNLSVTCHQKIQGLVNKNQDDDALEDESKVYLASDFMKNLSASEKGFFETIGATVYNEYSEYNAPKNQPK